MNKFSTPFMAKSPLPKKTLEEKVEEARRAAYIKGTPEYTDDAYEESSEEKKAQRKYKRLSKRLARKQKRKEQK